jgi:hypothetical protein
MTALVIYDGKTHDIARYVRPEGEKVARTHEGYVNDAFVGIPRSLQEFLQFPPEDLRIAPEPYDSRVLVQNAMRYMENLNAVDLGDI